MDEYSDNEKKEHSQDEHLEQGGDPLNSEHLEAPLYYPDATIIFKITMICC